MTDLKRFKEVLTMSDKNYCKGSGTDFTWVASRQRRPCPVCHRQIFCSAVGKLRNHKAEVRKK